MHARQMMVGKADLVSGVGEVTVARLHVNPQVEVDLEDVLPAGAPLIQRPAFIGFWSLQHHPVSLEHQIHLKNLALFLMV